MRMGRLINGLWLALSGWTQIKKAKDTTLPSYKIIWYLQNCLLVTVLCMKGKNVAKYFVLCFIIYYLDSFKFFSSSIINLDSSTSCHLNRSLVAKFRQWYARSKEFPTRILNQTCNASSCERNWSMFEKIHSKKRNRLTQKRLNDLAFVHYNLRLRNKQLLSETLKF